MIVAYDNERAIGFEGKMPWKLNEMREDMNHFRKLTMGAAVIMGRKTLESIGVGLPGRKNIVLTRSESVGYCNVEVAHSLDDAYSIAKDCDQVFIIGGQNVYEQALADVEIIYATEVDTIISQADAFFPKIDKNWQEIDIKEISSDDNNKYPCRFVTYERKR